MKATELRIGNWVNGLLDPVKIAIIDGDNPLYEPIPLTPEVLEKCGFEKLPKSKDVYRIFVNTLEISVNIKLHFAYIDTVWGQASIKNPIFKYLHQVQNLVHALTGTELEYKP